MSLTTGQILQNRYRIVKLLGQGGFGAVYRAWDLQLNLPRALKENLDTSPASVRQFFQEASILARLSHPSLPHVYDHFELPGQGQYLVMEFVEGESLEERVNRAGGGLPEAQLLPWIEQVCAALSYLHSYTPPVIHRDIKPANIKITPQGQAVLVDFGIAKLHQPGGATTAGARAVSPGYSPFEQYGRGQTDARSDVYALGATCYAVLTGQEPLESVVRAQGQPLAAPSSLSPAVSSRVERAVLTAMQMQPDQRYQSAAEFKAALSGQALLARRRAPLRVWGAAGVLLLAALAFFIFKPGGWLNTGAALPAAGGAQPAAGSTPAPGSISLPGAPSGRVASTPTSGFVIPPVRQPITAGSAGQVRELARWGKGALNRITLSPDGAFLAAASSLGVYIYDYQTLRQLAWIKTDASVSSLVYSSDSQVLATGHEDGTVALWRTSDNSKRAELKSEDSSEFTSEITGLAFSPDGGKLTLATSTVTLWDVPGRTLLRTFSRPQSPKNLAFSPDGKWLAIRGDQELVLWETGNWSVFYHWDLSGGRAQAPPIGLAFSPDSTLLAFCDEIGSIEVWAMAAPPYLALEVPETGTSFGSLSFSSNGRQLAAGTWRGFGVWELPGGNNLWQEEGSVHQILFGQDGNTLMTFDGLWVEKVLAADGKSLGSLEGHIPEVAAVDFSPDGTALAAVSKEPGVWLWKIPGGEVLGELYESPMSSASSVSFSPDGQYLGVGESGLDIWRASDNTFLFRLDANSSDLDVAFAPDGSWVAHAGYENIIYVWRLPGGEQLQQISAHTSAVTSLDSSPDGTLLASSSWDGTVRLWDTMDWSPVETLQAGQGESFNNINDVLFLPGGGSLVAVGDSGLHVWSIPTGKLLEHRGQMPGECLALSPDGSLLAIGVEDAIQLVSFPGLQVLHTLNGHEGEVNWVDFSPDGLYLASASRDGTVRVWGIVP